MPEGDWCLQACWQQPELDQNKHGKSRSYLCNLSGTNYDVRAVPPILTNESHLVMLPPEDLSVVHVRTSNWTGHYETVYFNLSYNISVHFMKNVNYATCAGRFMLSSGARFSSFVLMVFIWHEGKVGQFNTIWRGQALSYRTNDILIPSQKTVILCLKILFLIEAIKALDNKM